MLPHLNPVLVQRKPGNKPRGLKENVFSYWMTYLPNLDAHLEKEDEGDADGSADAESLEYGHDREGGFIIHIYVKIFILMISFITIIMIIT